MTNKEQEVALDFERMLLGVALNHPSAINEICNHLEIESFQNSQDRIIFSAIKRVNDNGKVVSIITVLNDLSKHKLLEQAGGKEYLASLDTLYIGDNTLNDLIDIVYKNWQSREFGLIVSNLQNKYLNFNNIEDLVLEAKQQFNAINLNFKENDIENIGDSATAVVNELKYFRDNPDKVRYLKTTFNCLDELLGGFEPASLNIISARSGIGKTSFAMNIAIRLAKYFKQIRQRGSILYFSLEMPKNQITKRMLAYETNIPLEKLRYGEGFTETEWEILANGEKRLKEIQPYLFIDDDVLINTTKLKATIERYKREHNLKVIFIDYLQLVIGENSRIEYQPQILSALTRQLKKIAMEENIVIIALSQLSRDVEKRADGMIYLSDLSGSSGLENNADTVMFIKRPNYYDPDEPRICDVEVVVAKNRHGASGSINLKFDKVHNRFGEVAQ